MNFFNFFCISNLLIITIFINLNILVTSLILDIILTIFSINFFNTFIFSLNLFVYSSVLTFCNVIIVTLKCVELTRLLLFFSWSAMKLICMQCWLRIYCLATVESKDYQKFEQHWEIAWWWSAAHWLRAEFSRSCRSW